MEGKIIRSETREFRKIEFEFDENNQLKRANYNKDYRLQQIESSSRKVEREEFLQDDTVFRGFIIRLGLMDIEKYKDLGMTLKKYDPVFYKKMKEVSEELQEMFKI